MKSVNESSEPLGGRLGTPAQLKALRISRKSAKSECAPSGTDVTSRLQRGAAEVEFRGVYG